MKPGLFTIWVGSDKLPEHIHTCIKSWIITGHSVKVYGYQEYQNLPQGAEFVHLEPYFPESKCVNNQTLTNSKNAGHSFCGVVNMMRIKIIKETGEMYVDADTFVTQNITPFIKNRKNLVSSEFSNWTKTKTFCNGFLMLDTTTEPFSDLYKFVTDYLEDNLNPQHYSLDTAGAKYFQEVLAPGYPGFVDEALSHQLFQCPISKKNQNSLLEARKLPLRAKPHIWGIHMWNTGFFDSIPNSVHQKSTLVNIMYRAVENPEMFEEVVNELYQDSIDDKDLAWLNVEIEDLMPNPFNWFGDIYVINLDNDLNRWLRSKAEFLKYTNMVPNRYKAIPHEYGYFGASLSHKDVVEKAKQRKLQNVLVCEDDVQFIYDKSTIWDILDKAIEGLQGKSWDGLWLGFTPRLENEVKPLDCGDLGNPFNLEVDWCGNYCYCVNGESFDTFYGNMQTDFSKFTREDKADIIIKFLPTEMKWIVNPPLCSVYHYVTRTGVTGKKQCDVNKTQISGTHIEDYYTKYNLKRRA